MLGHARILLVKSLPSSAQVKDVSVEAPLWDKYSSIINQLLLEDNDIRHYKYGKSLYLIKEVNLNN